MFSFDETLWVHHIRRFCRCPHKFKPGTVPPPIKQNGNNMMHKGPLASKVCVTGGNVADQRRLQKTIGSIHGKKDNTNRPVGKTGSCIQTPSGRVNLEGDRIRG